MNYENLFKVWMKNNPEHTYSDGTITGYIGALRNAADWFGVTLAKPIPEIYKPDELETVLNVITSLPDYETLNVNYGHGRFSAAVSAYRKFLSSMHDLTWVSFYMELADKLSEYRDDRKSLIEKLIKIFQTIDIKLPKLESDTSPVDIDPFTVFGLFNKGITEVNRRAIIKGLAEEFNISAEQPKSFPGIPLVNNQKATFYYFLGSRGENDIDNLWDLFTGAICLARDDNEQNREAFASAFDRVILQKGVQWNITMGLFWVRPYCFINLDSRNRQFIQNAQNTTDEYAAALPKLSKMPSGAEYLKICDNSKKLVGLENLPYSNLPELSAYAWSITKDEDVRAEEQQQRDSGNDSLADGDVRKTRYWIYSPGDKAEKWDEFYAAGIMGIREYNIGDLSAYSTRAEMIQAMQENGDSSLPYKITSLVTWWFANEIKPGDVIFVKKGYSLLLGRGIVTSDYYYDETADGEYRNIRRVNWTHNCEQPNPEKSSARVLSEITHLTDYVDQLCNLFGDTTEDIPEEPEKSYPVYTEKDFLHDVYMSEDDYHTLAGVLMKKKNIILQGAPGVGKTYAAKRLAYSIMGKKDQDRVMMIQFHQSYSYEDFIEGYRPTSEGFNIKKGAFYKFCKKAQEDDENPYFFIIDEINRGNLSKIFGELFMLIETDKRGIELQLLYSDEKFSVPANVHIIGMMNTADRSLAMLDYALRRRFSFIDMKPGFDTDGFIQYRDNLASSKFDALIRCVQQLNSQIKDDASLGEGFCIGHSYFCNMKADTVSDKELSNIVEFELIPLLREYWFDEADKVADWSARLRGVVK